MLHMGTCAHVPMCIQSDYFFQFVSDMMCDCIHIRLRSASLQRMRKMCSTSYALVCAGNSVHSTLTVTDRRQSDLGSMTDDPLCFQPLTEDLRRLKYLRTRKFDAICDDFFSVFCYTLYPRIKIGVISLCQPGTGRVLTTVLRQLVRHESECLHEDEISWSQS